MDERVVLQNDFQTKKQEKMTAQVQESKNVR